MKKLNPFSKKEPNQMSGMELLRKNNAKNSIQKRNEDRLANAEARKEKVRLIFPTDKTPLGKASFFVKLATIIVVIIILTLSVIQFMEYSKLENEKKEKEKRLEELQSKIDELNYYISSPIDEYYVRKFAWEIFGMVPSDGDVIIVNPEDIK